MYLARSVVCLAMSVVCSARTVVCSAGSGVGTLTALRSRQDQVDKATALLCIVNTIAALYRTVRFSTILYYSARSGCQ